VTISLDPTQGLKMKRKDQSYELA